MPTFNPSDQDDFFADFGDVSAGLGSVRDLPMTYSDVLESEQEGFADSPADSSVAEAVDPSLDRVFPESEETNVPEAEQSLTGQTSAFTADPTEAAAADDGSDFFRGVQPLGAHDHRDD